MTSAKWTAMAPASIAGRSMEVDAYLDWLLISDALRDRRPNAKIGQNGITKADASPSVMVAIEMTPELAVSLRKAIADNSWDNHPLAVLSGCRSARVDRLRDSSYRVTTVPRDEFTQLKNISGVVSITPAFNANSSSDGGIPGGETGADEPTDPVVPLAAMKVVAVIDHGCPFASGKFRVYEKGAPTAKSRVKLLWDQDPFRQTVYPSVRPNGEVVNAPVGSASGEYWVAFSNGRPGALLKNHPSTDGQISPGSVDALMQANVVNGIVDEEACYEAIGYHTMRSNHTHGAHVMDIACGWPNPLRERDERPDFAATADIIFVQLPRATVSDTSGGAMTAYVLEALHFIVENTSADADVVVNLSYGTFAGPHDGSSFLERAIDEICSVRPKLKVVLPAGNSFNEDCHAQLRVDKQAQTLRVVVPPDSIRDTFVELWWTGTVPVVVTLRAPDGTQFELPTDDRPMVWRSDSKQPLGYGCSLMRRTGLRTLSADKKNSMVLVAIAPTISPDGTQHTAPYGTWEIVLTSEPSPVVVDAWIERGDAVSGAGFRASQARFEVDPTDDPSSLYAESQPVRKRGTINTFATGKMPYVVGGVYANGAGTPPYVSALPARNGVDIASRYFVGITDVSPESPGILASASVGVGVARLNGTSVAAPQISRSLINNALPEAKGMRPQGRIDLQLAELRGDFRGLA